MLVFSRYLLLVLTLVTLGCQKKTPTEPTSSHTAQEQGPRRIVSLAPSVTETLFSLGAGDRVVGVTRFCDFPPEATKKTKVGGLTDVDVEMVLSLEPDLVVGVQSQTASALQRTLAASNINARFLPVETMADVEASITTLGTLVGEREKADAIVTAVEASRRAPSPSPPRVLVLFGSDPFIGAGPGTFADEMIRFAGGINALAHMDSAYPALDAEQMSTIAPDLVLDTSFGDKKTSIVGAKRVVRIDPALMRPGPRLPEAISIFADAIAEVAP